MLRRDIRLRREYIYRKSREEKQRGIDEKRQLVKQYVDENRKIPTHLQKDAIELQKQAEWGAFPPCLVLSAAQDLYKQNKYCLYKLRRKPPPEKFLEQISAIDDEYRWAGASNPKIVVTTSREPSTKLKVFAKEIRLMFPNAQRLNRGHYDVKKLIQACRANDVTDFILIQETRGNPDGFIVCHLPYGPTAFFTLSDVVMRHDVPDRENISETYPHLIFNNLNSRLGYRFTQILKHLFPVPKPDSKRIMTFSNDDDVISFRHHVYSKTEFGEIELKEVGPRFEMRPYCIKLGTLENIDAAQNEWILRPYINSAKRRQLLSQTVEDED